MLAIFLFAALSAFADFTDDLKSFMKENKVEKLSFTLKNLKHENCLDINLGMDQNEAIPVASSSKWVTASIILRLVDQKKLSLEDTTGKILGWKGEKGLITLHQLLSATSNLPGDNPCIMNPQVSLSYCIEKIYQDKTPLTKDAFNYGSTHFHVAMRMAEEVTGKTWNELVASEFKKPLGLMSEAYYYNIPSKRIKGQPLAAGGLVISTSDYLKFLAMVADGGRDFYARSLVEAQEKRNFTDKTVITFSPFAEAGQPFEYGMGLWRECLPKDCAKTPVISSMGLFGFYPWIDRENRNYGVLSVYHEWHFYKKTYAFMSKMRPHLLKITADCRNRK
jgi:CubicO group peptidase (beta-lactamase class C family)